jgi:hypothetical protein
VNLNVTLPCDTWLFPGSADWMVLVNCSGQAVGQHLAEVGIYDAFGSSANKQLQACSNYNAVLIVWQD